MCFGDVKKAINKVYKELFFTMRFWKFESQVIDSQSLGVKFELISGTVYCRICIFVYLFGHASLVDQGFRCLHFLCLGISSLCDWRKGTQTSSCFDSRLNSRFLFVLWETFFKVLWSLPHFKTTSIPCNLTSWMNSAMYSRRIGK